MYVQSTLPCAWLLECSLNILFPWFPSGFSELEFMYIRRSDPFVVPKCDDWVFTCICELMSACLRWGEKKEGSGCLREKRSRRVRGLASNLPKTEFVCKQSEHTDSYSPILCTEFWLMVSIRLIDSFPLHFLPLPFLLWNITYVQNSANTYLYSLKNTYKHLYKETEHCQPSPLLKCLHALMSVEVCQWRLWYASGEPTTFCLIV